MEREQGQIPHQEFQIEKPTLSVRERLFEVLFEYPLRLAEQVVDMGILSPEIDENFLDFHSSNVERIDEIMEQIDLTRGRREQS